MQPKASANRWALEWRAMSDFDAFSVSNEYHTMIGATKPFVVGPSKLQMFETNASPFNSATAPLTAVHRTSIKGSESKNAAEKVWADFAKKVGVELKGFAHGVSVNLEEEVYLGLLGWEEMGVTIS